MNSRAVKRLLAWFLFPIGLFWLWSALPLTFCHPERSGIMPLADDSTQSKDPPQVNLGRGVVGNSHRAVVVETPLRTILPTITIGVLRLRTNFALRSSTPLRMTLIEI